MYQPIYYLAKKKVKDLEKKGTIKPELLRAAGLGHLADEAAEIRFSFGEVANGGPDGGAGVLISCEAQAKDEGQRVHSRIGFYGDEQVWMPANEAKGLWIGYWKGHQPQAIDLQRTSTFGGGLVLTISDRYFLIPVVRRQDGTTHLPQDVKLCPFREIVKQRYADIWDRTAAAWDWVATGEAESDDFKIEPAVKLALDCLSLNYRVSPIEQNAFALIDNSNWLMVICCMLDITNTEKMEAAKKKARPFEPHEDANSSTGPKADSQNTSPVAATCT